MIYLLAGLAAFWLGLSALKAFTRANPAALARLIRAGAGAATLLAALFLLLRGRFDMAIGLGGLGAWLLKLGSGSPWRMFKPVGGAAGRVSCVRSAMIEMELDHETGKMRGTILAGPDEGKLLDSLTRPQCESLYCLCCRDDPEGARLLEAYLDRRFSGWRPTGQDQGDSGPAGARRGSGAMSKDEAYEVLGLQKGASREEVVRSHRSLMKKLHPDRGGTTDLAARVNEAKDVLMRRHQ
ncbi:DnaJ domain-containing protein [Methylocapsa aurea]|uniref:DnaJ domain-containing protein n=1 Tax=Methylocapsa aurea TaxID=663610 RepID=UPI000A5BF404|nr:DnaJ domain-containing protein [Methylocapsa aurea]